MCENRIAFKLNYGIKRPGNDTFNIQITINPTHLKKNPFFHKAIEDMVEDIKYYLEHYMDYIVLDKLPPLLVLEKMDG